MQLRTERFAVNGRTAIAAKILGTSQTVNPAGTRRFFVITPATICGLSQGNVVSLPTLHMLQARVSGQQILFKLHLEHTLQALRFAGASLCQRFSKTLEAASSGRDKRNTIKIVTTFAVGGHCHAKTFELAVFCCGHRSSRPQACTQIGGFCSEEALVVSELGSVVNNLQRMLHVSHSVALLAN